MQGLSSYAFSLLRDGDLALSRGSGTGLPPILLVAAAIASAIQVRLSVVHCSSGYSVESCSQGAFAVFLMRFSSVAFPAGLVRSRSP